MNTASPPQARNSIAITLILSTAIFAYSVLEAMLVPALPALQKAVGASTEEIVWVFTGLLLAGAVTTPIVGRLVDVTDKRRVLIGTLFVLCAGVALAATASSVWMLAVGQALQGVGLGLAPLAFAVLRDTQPAERLKTANGLIIGLSGLGSSLGLLFSGWLIERLPYTWLYWIPLFALLAMLVAAMALVPSLPSKTSGKVDWAGGALLALTLVSILLGLTFAPSHGWLSFRALGLIGAGVVLLAVFVIVELRVEHPLVDLRLVHNRAVMLTCVISFVVGFGTFAIFVQLPMLARLPSSTGYGLDATTLTVGLLLMPLGVLGTISAPLAGKAEEWLGARSVMAVGTALIASSCLILVFATDFKAVFYISSGVAGIGIGLALTQSMNIVVCSVPPEQTGSISSTAFVLRNVGGTLGGQVGAGILASDLIPNTPVPTWAAFETSFYICAAVGAVALVLSLALPARNRQQLGAA
ncbi:MFS transporter [Streptomyces sp. NPDC002870]|uniref:MFS transporter n=1 Tax=Streptomyces sp. NPDC002870 TaxID=3364666 RepID=UPI0036917C80